MTMLKYGGLNFETSLHSVPLGPRMSPITRSDGELMWMVLYKSSRSCKRRGLPFPWQHESLGEHVTSCRGHVVLVTRKGDSPRSSKEGRMFWEEIFIFNCTCGLEILDLCRCSRSGDITADSRWSAREKIS